MQNSRISLNAQAHFEDVRKSYGMKHLWQKIESKIAEKEKTFQNDNNRSILFDEDQDQEMGVPEAAAVFFEMCHRNDFVGLRRLFFGGFEDLDHTCQPHGNTMLMEAVIEGNVALTETLLSNGADPDQKNSEI